MPDAQQLAKDVLPLQGMVDQLKAEAEQQKLVEKMHNLQGDDTTQESVIREIGRKREKEIEREKDIDR